MFDNLKLTKIQSTKCCNQIIYSKTNKTVCFRILYREEEIAEGRRKRALQRQIEAVELEVITIIHQKNEELRLESERLERLLQSLLNE